MPTSFELAYVYNIKPTASGKTVLREHKENAHRDRWTHCLEDNDIVKLKDKAALCYLFNILNISTDLNRKPVLSQHSLNSSA